MKSDKFDSGRRRILGAGLAGAAMMAMPPLLRAADKSLKIGTYGGFFEESFKKHIYPDFTKATGIHVDSVAEPTGPAWLVQLQNAARAGRAPADVSMMSQFSYVKGQKGGLWAPFDESKLSNRKYLYDRYVQRNDKGVIYAIGGVSWYITLVTNSKAYPTAPESWKAFWDPKNKDKIGLLALANNSFLLDITAKTFFDGDKSLQTKDDILKVLKKLAEVRPNVRLWYRDEAQFQRQLTSGEIPMGEYYNDVTHVAMKKGFPVRSTFPKEGAVMDSGSWVVVKSSKKLDLAQVFIDYMCQPKIQTLIAETLGTAPTVQRKYLDMTDAQFAEVSSEITPIVPRYEMYVDDGDWLSDKWSQMLAGKL